MVNKTYSLITDPITTKKYSITSYTGKKILKNYINMLIGGAVPLRKRPRISGYGVAEKASASKDSLPVWLTSFDEYKTLTSNCKIICSEGEEEYSTCAVCPKKGKTQHGKLWESPVCKYIINDIISMSDITLDKDTLFNTWKYNSDIDTTAIHDISPELLGMEWNKKIIAKYGSGVSIKLTKNKCDVCMGDIGRIYNNFKEPWSIVAGFYTEQNIGSIKCKCVTKVYFLNAQSFNKAHFFGEEEGSGEITWLEHFENLKHLVKKAKGYSGGSGGLRALKKMEDADPDVTPDTSIHREITTHPLTQKNTDQIVKVRIKLDSTNSRVQGAITSSSFNKFAEKFGENISEPQLLGPILSKPK